MVCNYLLDVDFSICFSSDDVDCIWAKIKSIIVNACSKFVATTSVKSSNLPKWFSPSIRHLLNKIHTLRHRIKKQPPCYLSHNMEQAMQEQIDHAKSEYKFALIHKFAHDKSELYRFLSSLTTSNAMPNVLYHDNNPEPDLSKHFELFNQYFTSILVHSSFPLSTLSQIPLLKSFFYFFQ